MSDGGMTLSDLDVIVAAILTGANVTPPAKPEARVNDFNATLKALLKAGGAHDMWRAASGNTGA